MSNDQQRPGEIVVSFDYRLEPSPAGRDPEELVRAGVSLVLEDGRQIPLDPDDRRSAGFIGVIESLREQGRPLSVELGDDGRLGRLFAPHVSPVVALEPIEPGIVAVELAMSHARHLLHENHPDFERIRRVLDGAVGSGATVVVTTDDAQDIRDARIVEPGPGPPVVFERPTPATGLIALLRRLWDWIRHFLTCDCGFPFGMLRGLSATTAQAVFDDLAARTCNPSTPASPCIPFRYPDDGCWGRAHEMCRLMIERGLRPCKVWSQGALYVATANNPNCHVQWGWHVAPTHCVRGRGLFRWLFPQPMVFDPALFSVPVTKDQWRSVQNPQATLTDSSWTIFHLWSTTTNNTWFTQTDPSYTQTNSVLAFYRTRLQLRAVQHGPPPYPCP